MLPESERDFILREDEGLYIIGAQRLVANSGAPPLSASLQWMRIGADFVGLLVSVLAMVIIHGLFAPQPLGFTLIAICLIFALTDRARVLIQGYSFRSAGRAAPAARLLLKRRENETAPAPVRIIVVARPIDLLPFAELADAGFPPLVFQAAPGGMWLRRNYGLIAILSPAILFLLGYGGFWLLLAPAILLLAPLIAWQFAASVMRPTYYRLIPGRLDVLHGARLRSAVAVADSIELRRAEVRVNCYAVDEFITIRTDSGKTMRLPKTVARDPAGLAQAVVRAALCTAETPPTPTDRLLD